GRSRKISISAERRGRVDRQTNQPIRRLNDIWMLFTRGRIIGKLEEGRSVTSNGCRVPELLTASFHDFGDNFKLQEQLSGGSVVVVHEEPRRR
ncbi:hypothetical protein TNCV_4651991, partial [Trichonephila clavipes]